MMTQLSQESTTTLEMDNHLTRQEEEDLAYFTMKTTDASEKYHAMVIAMSEHSDITEESLLTNADLLTFKDWRAFLTSVLAYIYQAAPKTEQSETGICFLDLIRYLRYENRSVLTSCPPSMHFYDDETQAQQHRIHWRMRAKALLDGLPTYLDHLDQQLEISSMTEFHDLQKEEDIKPKTGASQSIIRSPKISNAFKPSSAITSWLKRKEAKAEQDTSKVSFASPQKSEQLKSSKRSEPDATSKSCEEPSNKRTRTAGEFVLVISCCCRDAPYYATELCSACSFNYNFCN